MVMDDDEEFVMATTNIASALPQDIDETARLNVAPQEFRAARSDEAVAGSPQFDPAAALPRSSVSVMVVIDDDGYLMPLCTAGDLSRWCKAAWAQP